MEQNIVWRVYHSEINRPLDCNELIIILINDNTGNPLRIILIEYIFWRVTTWNTGVEMPPRGCLTITTISYLISIRVAIVSWGEALVFHQALALVRLIF